MEPASEGRPGRKDRFATLVVPELGVLLRVAQSIVRRPADAEDLVQDTLLRAFRSLDGFDGAHPRAWLLTIMRNAEINRHRRRRPELLDDPEIGPGAVDPRPTPEELVVGEEFDTVVAEALAALPERFRRVVELVDVGGLRYREAAAVLGVPVGTVMSRLHRARGRIRTRLAAAGLVPKEGGR